MQPLLVALGILIAGAMALLALRRRSQPDPVLPPSPAVPAAPPPTPPPSAPASEGEDPGPVAQDPNDLVLVQGHQVRRRAAAAYQEMLAAARDQGVPAPLLEIVSGYRSRERQQKLWDAGLVKYRSLLTQRLGRAPTEAELVAETRQWVAPPGRSAHQSGNALDLKLDTRLSNSSENVAALRKTRAYQWLAANMAQYHFKPYEKEPWHIVYVG